MLVRSTEHHCALEHSVLAAFTTKRPCDTGPAPDYESRLIRWRGSGQRNPGRRATLLRTLRRVRIHRTSVRTLLRRPTNEVWKT